MLQAVHALQVLQVLLQELQVLTEFTVPRALHKSSVQHPVSIAIGTIINNTIIIRFISTSLFSNIYI